MASKSEHWIAASSDFSALVLPTRAKGNRPKKKHRRGGGAVFWGFKGGGGHKKLGELRGDFWGVEGGTGGELRGTLGELRGELWGGFFGCLCLEVFRKKCRFFTRIFI